MPRMLLITPSIDEFRKSPQMKLHSKHKTCSLIYRPSKTSSGIFIIRFQFLSRLRRTFIQNHIFRSTSSGCINTSDNVWQLFFPSFFFLFFFCSEYCPLKVPLSLSLLIFSLFYSGFSLEVDPWISSYFSRTVTSKEKRGHFCIYLDISEFSRLYQCLDQVKPSSWASLIAQLVKKLPAKQETPVGFLGWEDPLEKR